VENDSVSRREVDAHPASARRKQEARDVRVGVVFVKKLLPLFNGSGAIEAKVPQAQVRDKFLDDVEHRGPLREYQYPVSRLFQVRQQA
jgi:hypothetical protein